MSFNLSSSCLSQELSEKRSLEMIKTSLMTELEAMGFHAFSYEGIPSRIIQDVKAPIANRLFKLSDIAKAKTALTSNNDEFIRHKSYLASLKAEDLSLRKNPHFTQPSLYFINCREKKYKHNNDNFNSAIGWPVKAFCGAEWWSLFFLKSWYPKNEMQHWFSEHQTMLANLLLSYHLEFMLYYRKTFNPYTQCDVFSKKQLNVVRLAANGHSGKEIGDQLCMTERGVDYHIEQLRRKLQARNRLHLIKIAEGLEII